MVDELEVEQILKQLVSDSEASEVKAEERFKSAQRSLQHAQEVRRGCELALEMFRKKQSGDPDEA